MGSFIRHLSFWIVGLTLGIHFLISCKVGAPIGKWQDGVIPYYLSGDFTNSEVGTIRSAMNSWEKVANVTFKEVTPRAGAYHIIKVNENSWSSSIGENNSDCEMIFGSGGDIYSHVLHELGHALGLLHEHQRPDRDSYVRIIWSNLLSQYQTNFEKKDNPLILEEQYPYDYHSIMHYPAKSFSINGISNTIESLDSSHPIERLDVITTIDAEKAVEIYGLPVEN